MLQLAAVLLVYAGGLAALVGLACVARPLRLVRVRRRRTGALILAIGMACALVGFALPAPLLRIDEPRSRLDAVMPAYHFHEVHTVRVHAPPARILAAVHDVTAGEIRFFRTLTWIRSPRLGAKSPESILNAPENQPILDVALRSGFTDADGWSRLSTETRVLGTDDSARRRFAVYWRLIYPGSALIRRMWLQAVKRRAEAS
jgi:hypothetical protein